MKKFRIKLIFLNLLVVILVSICVAVGVYYIVKAEVGYYMVDKVVEMQAISSLSSDINKLLFVVIPLMLFISVVVSVYISNRINNSLDYVSKTIDAVISEDFTNKIQLPKARELLEFIEKADDFKETIRKKLVEQRDTANRAVGILSKILDETERADFKKEKISKLITELVAELEKLQVITNRVRL